MPPSGIVSVNDALIKVGKDGSVTAAIGSTSVYKRSLASHARKKEVNVRIMSTDDSNLIIRRMPLFDQHDIDAMGRQIGQYKYVHIGCITVSIEPLIHKKFLRDFGKSIKGTCIIFDPTFEVFEESIISAHKFDLSAGRADFVCYPNHCLSASDPNLSRRISVLLSMDNIRVKRGNEMMTLCIGHISTGTNTLNPTADLANEEYQSLALTGTSEIKLQEIGSEVRDIISNPTMHDSLDIIPTGQDQMIIPRRNWLMRPFCNPPKVVIRRNYTTDTVERDESKSRRIMASDDPARKSFSAPSSPNKITSRLERSSMRYPSEDKYYLPGEVIRQAVSARKDMLKSASSKKV